MPMGGRGLTIKNISMLCCLFICLRIKTAIADHVSCDVTLKNFTADSTYSKNRDTVLASLASNAAANGGFYNSSVGSGSDIVYATALCRGDASTTECSSCVTTVVNNSILQCPLQYKVFSWAGEPPCFVYYDNTNIFGVLEMNPPLYDNETDTISWDSSGFYETWAALMADLRNEAAAGSSKRKYAAGYKNFTLTRSIYGLVQCTPDLSKSDCDQCLNQTIADSDEKYHGLQGGLIYRPSCIFQYSLERFYKGDDTSPPPSSTGNGGGSSATTIAIVVGSVAIFIAIVAAGLFLFRRQKKRRKMALQLIEIDEDGSRTSKYSHLDFGAIRAATNNFSDNKKLGQGGFGTVYKGTLPNGQEIAVKRLARNSQQGELEFQSEVKLMTKLRHRNLVRLIGFSTEKEERVLVYEFLPNSSLNNYIFDTKKRYSLDWTRRQQIISGIARGLLYLHEDSRLRIVHRDLKPSNILIDEEMNAKIADFGTARLFAYDQTQDNTNRISGTHGYMAPEYVMHGQFSVKSDVFSFGVLALEIVSGQRNMRIENGELIENLVTKAWRSWNEGNALSLIDPILGSGPRIEIMKCIHIALLCVQESAADRPSMGSVVQMLGNDSLPVAVPLKPAYFIETSITSLFSQSSSSNHSEESVKLTDEDALINLLV